MLTNKAQKINYVIDFDSTFTKVEGLDELAAIALTGHKDQQKIVGEIKAITDRGMAGEIGFAESLKARVNLLPATREHVATLIEFLKGKISDSFARNEAFIHENAANIYIASSGF